MSDENKSDFMVGAEPIAKFVSNLLGISVPPKTVYQWDESGRLRLGRFGRHLLGSKTSIEDDLRRAASPQAEPATPPVSTTRIRGRRRVA
jgi:hypothetical protein